LLPYQEAEARNLADGLYSLPIFRWSAPGMVYNKVRGWQLDAKRNRAVFNSLMMVQPVDENEFEQRLIQIKGMFGEDSRQARSFYDKYINSYGRGEE
jgi:hypothetical protein